ncbi:larval cuticle protein A3A-like [Ischnura elegans]|uniref:larval cuticle protein A3A-like n=1 Tax=Ischnura elegans TaxID=197161 RepID=UPI001ED87D4E|nr:larval cuticle protein A3A-like [Ischnura elegans]
MAFKFVVFAALVAVARAGVIPAAAPLAYAAPAYAHAPLAYAAPVAKAVVAAPVAKAVAVDTDFDPNPQYSYSYDIQDALTGDSKGQTETRNGDVVQGSYSLVEPDGTRRVVEYTADPVNGFNAVVHKEGAAVVKAAVAAPVAVKTVAAAPAVAYHAAPAVAAYHAAPAVAAYHAAPVAYKTLIH